MRHTTAAVAAATAVTALLTGAASAAVAQTAGLPTWFDSKKDAGDVAHRLDIREISMSSATSEEPAAVAVTVKKPLQLGDAATFWLNLDKDSTPEIRIDAGADTSYLVRRVDGWGLAGKNITGKGCGRVDMSSGFQSVELSFGPHCWAPKSTSYTASVKVFHLANNGTETKKDFAPARHRWLPRVKADAGY